MMERLKSFLTVIFLLLVCTASYAQTEISGTVTDDAGEPIIGASVVEKGTTNGTITDLDGNFQLSVENGKTIVVSYIGYMSVEFLPVII